MGACGQELSQHHGACRRQVLGPKSEDGLLKGKNRLPIAMGPNRHCDHSQEYGSQILSLRQLDKVGTLREF